MKKLLALALALMLLLASAAIAETANVATLSNFQLLVSGDDGSYTVDLSDLNATFAVGAPEGVPTIQMDLLGGSDQLLGAVIQFINGNVVLAIDGVSRPMAASMNNADAQKYLEELFANLDSVSEVKLPAFQGVDIPKIPLMGVADVLPMLGVQPQTDGDATTFEIPAELISGILQMVMTQLPAETKAQLGGLDQVLANLQVAIDGRLSDNGETAEMLLNLVPVENGRKASEPFAALYFVSTQNSDSLEFQLYQEGQAITMAQLDLASDPAAATLDFAFDLMGQFNLSFSLYPQDGAQVAALEVKADQETIKASLIYGEEGDTEYAQLAFEIPNENVSGSLDINEHPTADGGKEGALALNIAANGQTINLTADVAEGKGDVVFRPITNADQAYDANAMSEADSEAFGAELEAALAPLMNYMNSIEAQPAA